MDAWRRDAKRRGPNDAIADRQKAAQAAAAARAFLAQVEATRAAEAVALSENDLAASALETAEKLREQFDAEAAMRREARPRTRRRARRRSRPNVDWRRSRRRRRRRVRDDAATDSRRRNCEKRVEATLEATTRPPAKLHGSRRRVRRGAALARDAGAPALVERPAPVRLLEGAQGRRRAPRVLASTAAGDAAQEESAALPTEKDPRQIDGQHTPSAQKEARRRSSSRRRSSEPRLAEPRRSRRAGPVVQPAALLGQPVRPATLVRAAAAEPRLARERRAAAAALAARVRRRRRERPLGIV